MEIDEKRIAKRKHMEIVWYKSKVVSKINSADEIDRGKLPRR